MWQVAYNPSVVLVLSSGGKVSNSGFKRRRYTNSSAAAGRHGHGKWQSYSRIEAGDIALSADGRILSAVKRAGLFCNLGKFLQTSHSLLGSVLRYGFKTSSGMVPFVEQVLLYKLYTTTAGFKAVMRR